MGSRLPREAFAEEGVLCSAGGSGRPKDTKEDTRGPPEPPPPRDGRLASVAYQGRTFFWIVRVTKFRHETSNATGAVRRRWQGLAAQAPGLAPPEPPGVPPERPGGAEGARWHWLVAGRDLGGSLANLGGLPRGQTGPEPLPSSVLRRRRCSSRPARAGLPPTPSAARTRCSEHTQRVLGPSTRSSASI